MNAPAPLPEGYHRENFLTLTHYVADIYHDLLTTEEHEFLDAFHGLPDVAQSLYVRLVMRKGPLFRLDKLQYADIEDSQATLQLLAKQQFISLQPEHDNTCILALLTKPELLDLYQQHSNSLIKGLHKLPKNQSKPAIVETFNQLPNQAMLRVLLAEHYPWLERHHDNLIRRLKLLFFGNARQDLSEFITTQLGIVTYENYRVDHNTRFYQNRHRLEVIEQLADNNDWQDQYLADADIEAIAKQIEQLLQLLQQCRQDEYLQAKCQRHITRLARHLERLDPDQALHAYQHSLYPPSRERQARILAKQGNIEQALAVINAIDDEPQHPDEPASVAALKKKLLQQVAATPGKKVSKSLTGKAINAVPSLTLTLPQQDTAIELQVAEHLSNQDTLCLHTENQLFCGLLGLLLWDIIFSEQADAFFNPYQFGPKDLWTADFYLRRKTAIENRLQLLRHEAWQPVVQQHQQQKQGIANYLVNWQLFDETTTALFCRAIPGNHLESIFRLMLTHLGYYRNGFPDLVVIQESGYQLWEVKGPTDKLQSNQQRWLQFFQQASIPAGVIYVQWQAE